jgi:hypothetical protein
LLSAPEHPRQKEYPLPRTHFWPPPRAEAPGQYAPSAGEPRGSRPQTAHVSGIMQAVSMPEIALKAEISHPRLAKGKEIAENSLINTINHDFLYYSPRLFRLLFVPLQRNQEVNV